MSLSDPLHEELSLIEHKTTEVYFPPVINIKSQYDTNENVTSSGDNNNTLTNTKNSCYKKLFIIIGYQIISILLASTGILTKLLNNEHFNAPLIQVFPLYFSLSLFLPIAKHYDTNNNNIKSYYFIFFGFSDLSASFLVLTAYHFTTIASVQIINAAFCLVVIFLLSKLCLGYKYLLKHYISVLIAVGGLTLLVLSDSTSHSKDGNNNTHMSRAAIGDLITVVGATFYGISNVTEEYVLKKLNNNNTNWFSSFLFLGNIGLYGSFFCIIFILIFELETLSHISLYLNPLIITYWISFYITLLIIYLSIPQLLIRSSATLQNISFLTSYFYGLIGSIFIFNYNFSVLYFIGFVITIAGLSFYYILPQILVISTPINNDPQYIDNYEGKSNVR